MASKFFTFILTLTLFCHSVFAATLSLTHIGSLQTQGADYTEWYYTGTNPTFHGKASPNTTVRVRVDSTEYSGQSTAAGDWSVYVPLTEGDYQINISSNSDTISFTLHLGQNLPSSATSQTSQSSAPVPDTGSNQMVAIFASIGISMLALILYFSGTGNSSKSFERRILKED